MWNFSYYCDMLLQFGTAHPESKYQHIIKYRRHNAAVRSEVPKDKLLIFKLTDGWEPICKFLDVDIPDEPFPWANRAAPDPAGWMAKDKCQLYNSKTGQRAPLEIKIVTTVLVLLLALLIFAFLF
eukprot:TRINITY_DN21944_c0_g1_i1.p2 TRINITY_DN21944_c0_g1~~TRINITY_DN21944_c0_g1_i1.p2  ORF type:complete len:125 (+),score=11.68 TRINITY_DN21944_c0_g1_i1:65-439(+)